MFPIQQHASRNRIQQGQTKPFLHRTHKLSFIFAALFVCYSSHSRLRDSQLRPCNDFLLFFTTQTRPVHRETDRGDEKFITPINKIHNPILGYGFGLCWPSPASGGSPRSKFKGAVAFLRWA